jgi:hypothetical protein
MIIISLLIAVGNHTPLFPFLYRYIPSFNMFQAPTRITIWIELCIALGAGFGIEAWRKPIKKGLYWSRLATAGAFAITIGSGLTWFLMGNVTPTLIYATVKAGILCFSVGLLFLNAPINYPDSTLDDTQRDRNIRLKSLWEKIVVVFVMVDLIWAGWGLNPGEKTELFTPGWKANSELRNNLTDGRLYLSQDDEYGLIYMKYMRFDTFHAVNDWSTLRSAILPNLNILDHIRSVNNFDPIVPSRYAIWMEELNRSGNPSNNMYYERLLNLSGIRLVEKMLASKETMIKFLWVRNNSRFRWVPCAMLVDNGEAAIKYLTDANIDVETSVVIETTKENNIPVCNPNISYIRNDNVQLKSVSDQSNLKHLIVQTSQPGWLVVSDTWYPGWRARVNGNSREIYKANYLFQAILLEAGNNDVIISYNPNSFIYGCGLSFLGVVLFVALCILRKHRMM